MSNLISGKEALIALANGNEVLYISKVCKDKPNSSWGDAKEVEVEDFLNDAWSFKLKPRTITLNGIEVPAPFEPKDGDDCRAYVIDTRNVNGYDWQHSSRCNPSHIAWRTEEEIKQVVDALRKAFKGGVE